MKVIYPYDLKQISLESLISDKKILLTDKSNKAWKSTIFPNNTNIQKLQNFDSNRLVVTIDESMFNGFTILRKYDDYVYNFNNTKRLYIKSKEIGDFNNSIKRYTELHKPIGISKDAQETLIKSITNENNIKQDNYIFNNNELIPNINNSVSPIILSTKYNNTINIYNNITILKQVFTWAQENNIKYIYCINEHRSYAFSKNYVMPYVYYTITGF